jgi:hypothetical protein
VNVLILIAVLWVLPIFIAGSIGKSKGRQGAAYGILLGWVGVLIVAVLPPGADRSGRTGECPFCKERMRSDATVCPHCQRDVVAGSVVVAKPHRSGRLTV